MTKWKLSLGFYRLKLNKMNKNNAFVKWYMIITLPLILLFSSFYYWMYNDAYFQNQFEKFDVYSGFDLTKEELNIKNSELIYYLKDGSNLIEDNFYNRAEKEHLRDVRVLMQGGTNLLIFLAVMWLTGIFIVKNDFYALLMKGSLLSIILFGAILLLIPLFETAFIYFHQIFFKAGTWMFDPAVSNMKRMFPDEFFFAIVKNIFLTFGGLSLTGLFYSWKCTPKK